jgi:alginate O-acetyltransferase complex protein AlgI
LRSLGYFLGWVGLDARRFLDESVKPSRPAAGAWAWAMFNSLSGAALLWGAAGSASAQPRLAGWIGLAGMGLLLHFGFFNLLALAWQRAGVNAAQIMNAPVLATSVAEFWSRRWNMAFRDLAHRFVFRPLCPRSGVAAATFAVFLVSGLLHELVVSLPAGGGYGLPSAYFVSQWVALRVERSRAGKDLGLGGGWRGWLFMMAATAGPAFYLFHPPFIRRVVVPFLQVLGAL